MPGGINSPYGQDRIGNSGVERLLVHGDGVRRHSGIAGCGRTDREPVAGIAMGLIKEGNQVLVLSDILGPRITWAIWILR